MTSKLVCAYCGKGIDEGESYDWEQDTEDPSIVYNFHPKCWELREFEHAAEPKREGEKIDLKAQTYQWLFQAFITNGEEFESLATTPDVHIDELEALREWREEIWEEIQRRKLEREWSEEYSVKVNSIADESHAKIREEERGIDWDDIDPEERITDGDDD